MPGLYDDETVDLLKALAKDPGLRLGAGERPEAGNRKPIHEPFRPGDVRHSAADLTRARRVLGFQPRYDLRRGLDETVAWFQARRERGSIAGLTVGKAPR